jgi:hypothetical protein
MAIRKATEDIQLIPAVGSTLLGATFSKQERNNWCWAACCDMALSQRQRPGVMQCEIAKTYLTGDCCDGSSCDAPCAIRDVREVFVKNGLGSTEFLNDVLSESALRVQLSGSSANTVAAGLKGSPNHMVLVVGFTGSLFRVYDPADGDGLWKYDEIMRGLLRKRTWKWTWKDLR